AGGPDASAGLDAMDARDASDADVKTGDVAGDRSAADAADGGGAEDSDAGAALLSPFPRVRNQGGPVLAKLVLTAVTYDGYDLRAAAEDVVATIGTSDYWNAATTEYG